MRIKHVTIHNWRSIRHLDIDVQPFMIFLGPNNCGKSNVLSALNLFFSPSEKADETDRCSTGGLDEDVSVEVEFDDLTEQDRTTFKQYILPGNYLRLVKTCPARAAGKGEYHGYRWVPEEEWLNPDSAGDYLNKEQLRFIRHTHCDIIEVYFPGPDRVTKAAVERSVAVPGSS
jgi:putative ATP-dependent endonuclease of OLD family